MANTVCGWCGTSTHVTEFSNGVEAKDEFPDSPQFQSTFRCDACGGLLVGGLDSAVSPGGFNNAGVNDISYMKNFWVKNKPEVWSPTFVKGQSFPDVPPHIAKAASEAFKGSSIGNHMSAILMARTVIEASAKEKGITKGNLLSKIDDLAKQSLIRADTKEAAHAIREFGNDMAHGDISDPVYQEDSEEVLVLMSEILNELFQGPARVQAIKAKVAARKAKP